MRKHQVVFTILFFFAIIIFFTFISSSNKKELKIANPGNHTVVVTFDGFSPSTITIKQGETISFINKGDDDHWPASDGHPVHDNYPQFDSKRPIRPGGSWTFKFDKVGKWGYHDHLYPGSRGSVIVESE